LLKKLLTNKILTTKSFKITF